MLTCSQFGSAKAGSQGTEKSRPQFTKLAHHQTDGAMDDDASYEQTYLSGPMTRFPPFDPPPRPEAVNTTAKANSAPKISRSPSPATGHRMGKRADTPMSFNYAYPTMRNGFFPGSHTPTAIRS